MYKENTENTSFLEMSKLLKIMGVENNMFMLYQKDETLQDPFGYDLTTYETDKIIEESKNNIWYFLREVIRIPYGTAFLSKFILNPSNMAMIYFLEKKVNIYNLGCRYASNKTMTILSYLLWKALQGKRTNIFLKCRSEEDIKIREKLLSNLLKHLPSYILKSIPIITVNQEKEKSFYWYDEAEFLDPSDIREEEICSKDNYIVMTSTIGTNNNQILKRIRCNSIPFCYSAYDNNIINKWIYLKFNANDLGKSEEWKDNVLKDLNNDQTAYNREILLIRDEENE
jgi:hypothetical protein